MMEIYKWIPNILFGEALGSVTLPCVAFVRFYLLIQNCSSSSVLAWLLLLQDSVQKGEVRKKARKALTLPRVEGWGDQGQARKFQSRTPKFLFYAQTEELNHFFLQCYSLPSPMTHKHSKLVVFLWRAICFESSLYVSFHFWEHSPQKSTKKEHGVGGGKLCKVVPSPAIYNGETLETAQMFSNGSVYKKSRVYGPDGMFFRH